MSKKSRSKLWFLVHSWLALPIWFFVLIMCVTGTLAVPPKTPADADLWITMEGWDGSLHQAAIPLSQASPATLAWLNKQGGNP